MIKQNPQPVAPAQKTPDDFFLPDFCAGRAVFILVLVTELFVIAVTLAATGLREFGWDHLALVSLFAQWVVLVSALLLCRLRRRLEQLPLPAATLAIFALVLAVTALVSLIAAWVQAGASFDLPLPPVDSDAMLRNLIISAIMTGLVLRYFYVQTRLRKQERAELQARVQALQARIRPHFLFNSMNIIASLIATDPARAERVVEDLSELFRASLKGMDAPVSLAQEIELCQRYMGIEQLRLGERMRVKWSIEDFPATATIPSLSLQPLLENAIYHGIQPLPEGGTIGVSVQQLRGHMQVTISNPYSAELRASHRGQEKSNNIALDNIVARFQALYGEHASLKTSLSENIFVTQLRWPLHA